MRDPRIHLSEHCCPCAALQGDLYGYRRNLSGKLQSSRWWLMPSEAVEGLAAAQAPEQASDSATVMA